MFKRSEKINVPRISSLNNDLSYKICKDDLGPLDLVAERWMVYIRYIDIIGDLIMRWPPPPWINPKTVLNQLSGLYLSMPLKLWVLIFVTYLSFVQNRKRKCFLVLDCSFLRFPYNRKDIAVIISIFWKWRSKRCSKINFRNNFASRTLNN